MVSRYFLLCLKELYIGLSLPKFVLSINFHRNLKIVFRKLNHFLIMGAQLEKKLQSYQLFSVDPTDHIEVLRLIKWIFSKKLLQIISILLNIIIAIIKAF